MSVIIKGLKMPKEGCKDCQLVARGLFYDVCPFLSRIVNGNVERGGKPYDCPVVDPLVELRSIANECYRGEVLYDAGIDAVLKRSEASLCDNCDEQNEKGCSWCKRLERSEDDA